MIKRYIPALALAVALAGICTIGGLTLGRMEDVPERGADRVLALEGLTEEADEVRGLLSQAQEREAEAEAALRDARADKAEAEAALAETAGRAAELAGLTKEWGAVSGHAEQLRTDTANASCFGYVRPPDYDLDALEYLQAGTNVTGLLGGFLSTGTQVNTQMDLGRWTALMGEITARMNGPVQDAQDALSRYYARGSALKDLLPDTAAGDELVARMRLYELRYAAGDGELEQRRVEMVHALRLAGATLKAYERVYAFCLTDSSSYCGNLTRTAGELEFLADTFARGTEGEALTEAEAVQVKTGAARELGRAAAFLQGTHIWKDHRLSQANVTSTTHKITTATRNGRYCYIVDQRGGSNAYYVYSASGQPAYFCQGADEVVFEGGAPIFSTYDEVNTQKIYNLAVLLYENGYNVRKEYEGYAVY